MKTIKNLRITAVLGLPLVCATLMSCSQESLSFMIEPEQIQPTPMALTQEECRYLITEEKDRHISPEEALGRIIDHEGNFTRGNNDLQATGVIYKEEIGIEGKHSVIPDTLAYYFNSESMGRRYIVSADNRTPQSLLAQFSVSDEELPMNDTEETIKDIIRKGIANYVSKEITKYESQKDSILAEAKQKLALMTLNDSSNVTTRAKDLPGYGNNDEYRIVERSCNIRTIASKDAMILVNWNQGAPYNDAIKDTMDCTFPNYVPVGCVPLAVGQLLSFWKVPMNVNGEMVDWNGLTSTNTIPKHDIRASKVAALLKQIFVGCQTIPDCGKSSSNIPHMSAYLSYLGFAVGDEEPYSSSAITNSLDNSRPVFVRGFNADDTGHLWLIDGYEYLERYRIVDTYVYDRIQKKMVLLRTDYITDYSTNFHHNWGMGFIFDGWYADGCFEMKNKTAIDYNDYNANYCYDVFMITQIRPND